MFTHHCPFLSRSVDPDSIFIFAQGELGRGVREGITRVKTNHVGAE